MPQLLKTRPNALQRLATRLDPNPQTYIRLLYFKFLAAAYFIAFVSFLVQFDGLLGENGIFPVYELTRQSDLSFLNWRKFFYLPTLAWFNDSDQFLKLVFGLGCLSSGSLFFNILPRANLLWLWFSYLSLVNIGNVFFAYQWESLILECGFLGFLLSADHVVPLKRFDRPISKIALWLTRWLYFRLMFGSGLAQLLSGDIYWRGLTALQHHYETQPLPTPVAWYVHQLPAVIHQLSTLLMFVIELVVPFLLFFPPKYRRYGFVPSVLLQMAILSSGNYTYFNWLSLGLCLFFLDDTDLRRYLRWKWLQEKELLVLRRSYLQPLIGICIFIASLRWGLCVSLLPQSTDGFTKWFSEFRIVNSYSLFGVMTTPRYEIEIEGSHDGKKWTPYVFKYKPGPLNRRPPWVAPHQPRLDWQAWFAALGDFERQPWLKRTLQALAKGNGKVLSLFESNPSPQKPPKFLRVQKYLYQFTNFSERRESGNWWKRKLIGRYNN